MIKHVFSDKRYIVHEKDDLLDSPNPWFVSIEPELHSALIISNNNDDKIDKLISCFYTTNRLSDYTDESRQELFRRMPQDVQALAIQTDNNAVIGILEMDLIDFILNYSSNKVLSIEGHIGIGKTTFLKYVLNTIRPRCPSLSKFLPIIINCLSSATKSPAWADIFHLVETSLNKVVENEIKDASLKDSIINIGKLFRDTKTFGSSRVLVESSETDQHSLLKVSKITKTVTHAFHCFNRVVNAFNNAGREAMNEVV